MLNSQTRRKDKQVAEFEVLFKTHYKSLCFTAFNIVKDIDTAEEIVQEFFYNYWKNRSSINIKTSVKAYLFKSVYNSSLKHIRSEGVRQRHADYVINHNKVNNNSASQELEAKELRGIIEQTLDELSQRHACIFRMSRYEGLKYREIADELSVSVKTVEAAMGKALAAFRYKLRDYIEFASNDIKQTKLTYRVK